MSVDYQAAIEALLDQAAGGSRPSAGISAGGVTRVAGWTLTAVELVARMISLPVRTVANHLEAQEGSPWASQAQSTVDAYVVSQLPEGVTVDDWVALYLTGRSRPTRTNPLARSTQEGRPIPTPPFALLAEVAEGDLGDLPVPPPPTDSRPRHGDQPVDYLPAPPDSGYTPQLAAPDLSSPAMRQSLIRWAAYFAQNSELWATLVEKVLAVRSGRGKAINAECMRALAAELPEEMRKALYQHQCGFPAPVGLKRQGKDVFMTLKIAASGVSVKDACGCAPGSK